MKATLFAAALALTASAALAQTTPPSSTSGTQTGNPSTTNMPSNGTTTDPASTTNNGRMDNMSGMSHSDKKAMHKSKKMKSSDGSMKTKTKM